MLQANKATNGQYISHQSLNNQLYVITDNGSMKLTPYTDRIIRITYILGDVIEDFNNLTPSLSVIAQASQVEWQLVETEASLTLVTEQLQLSISKSTSSITYKDINNNVLLSESELDSKSLDAFPSYKTILDDTVEVDKVNTADGIKETIINAKKVFNRTLYHGRLNLDWNDSEALYGLGQQEEGILNLRKHRHYIHQANKKIAMPFLVSTNHYGLLMDTYSPMIFSDNEYGSYLYTEAVEALDYYFLYGEKMDDIISGYRYLTGKASMLPKWSFGYMQSFERYESAEELISTIEEYRRRDIPIDSIVLDWQSWIDGHWGQKSFDSSRFGDPKEMIDTLHALNVAFMISIWPNMYECTDDHKEMKANKLLLDRSDIYNAFDKSARDLYWKQCNEGLFKHGVDAWWTDASEPFTPAWLSQKKSEPELNYLKFHDIARTYLEETMTNAYPLLHAKTLYEGQRSVTLDKRVCNLTRSGYTGQQCYGNILWSGDITATWDTLRKQISAGLNLCASGLPYWTLDIGAFFVKNGKEWFWKGQYNEGNKDENYRKLYTRWFQFATFLPVLRAHGTDTRREVWQFGDKGDIYYDTIVKFIQLRYKLLPYIYSMAGSVTQKHYTMLRLLAFDYGNDPLVFNIDDQFMFGSAMMVCPITESTTERSLYLPDGSNWYDFWTNQPYKGGSTLTVEAPIGQIPVFIKEGAIIPMTSKEIQHTGQCPNDSYELHIYKGANGKFTFYEDAGNNYDYENDQYLMIDITWKDDQKLLSFSNVKGSYKGMSETIKFKLYINGIEKESIVYDYTLKSITIG